MIIFNSDYLFFRWFVHFLELAVLFTAKFRLGSMANLQYINIIITANLQEIDMSSS